MKIETVRTTKKIEVEKIVARYSQEEIENYLHLNTYSENDMW